MAISIKDIASRVGVSDATVSLALNGNPRISEKRRKQIIKICSEMGYRPNMMARGLAKGKTRTIGFLSSALQVEIAAAKVVQMDALAREAGYNIYVSYSKSELDLTRSQAEDLVSRGVDGLVIYGGFGEEPIERQRKMLNFPVPVVFLDGVMEFPCQQVFQDKSLGIYQAVEHLVSLGHRSISMLAGYSSDRKYERISGFMRAKKDFGLESHELDLIPMNLNKKVDENGHISMSVDVLHASIDELLRRHNGCTAMICTDDLIALETISWLSSKGFNVPKDFSVVGFDGIPASAYSTPPLTTVIQPVGKLVRASWDMIINGIRGVNVSDSNNIVIPTELMIRNSTGPARNR